MADEIQLRDGMKLPLRPVEPPDKELLRRGFERLSPESRYRRFFTPVQRLTEADLVYLTEVDHHTHEALVALHPASGEVLAVARFVVLPERPGSAEAAVTVADDWHGRGLGRALLERLVDRARAEGVKRFAFTVLADNDEMQGLVGSLGPVKRGETEEGVVEFELELPDEAGIGTKLPSALREAAAQTVRVVLQRLRPPAA